MRWALLLLVAFAAAPVAAQDLGVPAAPTRGAFAIPDVTIHPISGPPIEGGAVVVRDGRIDWVGPAAELPVEQGMFIPDPEPSGGPVLHLWPGMIAPFTNLGLTEIGAVRATRDQDEVGPFTPEVRAAVAVNPDSTLLPVARTNGILLAGTFPSGGLVPGRGSIIRLDGWTWEDLAVRPEAGLVVTWPASRAGGRRWRRQDPEKLREKARTDLARLEAEFAGAKAYLAARAAGLTFPRDLRYEAMEAVLPGPDGAAPRRPVFFHAGDHDQILGALGFARRHGLRPVLVGARDADLCLPVIRESGAPVILTSVLASPRRSDSPYDEAYRLPARLREAGIPFCLGSGQGASNERNLPYAAAMAVAHGLDGDAAMRAITLSAAEILEIQGDYGSIEVGKSATMILTDGSPLDLPTKVRGAWIDGRWIDLGNKQTALAAKYRAKYREETR